MFTSWGGERDKEEIDTFSLFGHWVPPAAPIEQLGLPGYKAQKFPPANHNPFSSWDPKHRQAFPEEEKLQKSLLVFLL